jgi:hypothetical protein
MNLFACLSPVKDLQYFLWLAIVQSLIAFLATPVEMPQAFFFLYSPPSPVSKMLP